jgi:HAD superfamily hydrolase (TIGR01509 family)
MNSKHILLDFSRVLLFPTDESYLGSLNDRYREIVKESDYDYFKSFTLNSELLDFLKSLKPRFTLSIFTSEIIQNDKAVTPFLESIFERIFSAQEIGLSKTQKEAYLKIAEFLNEKPENIFYIDDKEVNVQTASEAGLKAVRYVSNPQIISQFKLLTR